MEQPGLEARVRNLVHRVIRMEQILPGLATKADLDARIAALATTAELRSLKEELQQAMSALPTRFEIHEAIRAEGEQTRRHCDVVAEGLRTEIRLLAEGLVAVREQDDVR